MDRQIGFSRPEVTISLRERSSHELSRCACERVALARHELCYVDRSRMRNNCIYAPAGLLYLILASSPAIGKGKESLIVRCAPCVAHRRTPVCDNSDCWNESTSVKLALYKGSSNTRKGE